MALEPLIPYITLPEIPLLPALDLGENHFDGASIKPFGALVALGVYLGFRFSMRQGARYGMPKATMESFFTWIIAGGFIGGHVFDVILYHPDKVLKAKDLVTALQELLFIWRSQASFGGFMGAICGLVAWKIKFKVDDALPYCDTAGATFPLGWVFGRMGCSVAHDHPGMRSDAWFAVQYPGGGRFDLGLYEMLFTIPLALTFLYLMRRPRPWGFYIGLMCTAYAPTRFAMDFLRAKDVRDADPRHLGLTPAQWLAIGLLSMGIYFLVRAIRAAERGETPRYVLDPEKPMPKDDPKDKPKPKKKKDKEKRRATA